MARGNRLLVGSALGALITLATASSAQTPKPTTDEYAKAIYADILPRWQPYSYSSELTPGESCAVRVIQMPGGDVLSIDFLPDCDFDKADRAAIVDAVRQSQPLPYHGFESVYQREIRIVFHAPSVEEHEGWLAAQAETERVKKADTELDRQWQATAGARLERDQYTQQCSFHLLWNMPKVKLQHSADVIVSLDKSGKVVGVTGTRGEPVDERLAAAFRATSPCGLIPADLVVGADAFKIGPLHVARGSD